MEGRELKSLPECGFRAGELTAALFEQQAGTRRPAMFDQQRAVLG